MAPPSEGVGRLTLRLIIGYVRYGADMIPAEVSESVEACRRWLLLDRDVVIVGDVGSGKSTVLAALGLGMARVGVDALRFSASEIQSDVPFGALLAHDALQRLRTDDRPTVQGLVRVLGQELTAPQNVIVVDDIDTLDASSTLVLEQLLLRPDVRLVAALRQGAGAGRQRSGSRLIDRSAVAEVRVAPLGFCGMAALLGERLGAPADARLISSVLARSAGNPGVALALLDAGRFGDAVRLVDGLWTQAHAPEGGGDQMVLRLLTGHLPPDATAALETLSCSGPVTYDDALALVGEAPLAVLGRHERLTVYSTEDGVSLTVSPPALARAVKTGLGSVRRQLLTRQAEDVLGPADEPVVAGTGEPGSQHSARGGDGSAWSVGVARLAALVHERAAGQDAVRRSRWRSEPSMDNATQFLDSLMARPVSEDLDEIFHETREAPSDAPGAVAAFRMREAQWMLWQTQDLERVTSFLQAASRRLGSAGLVLQAQAHIFQISSEGRSSQPGLLDHLDVGGAWTHANAWSALVRAGLLLESGRAQESLAVLDAVDAADDGAPGWSRRYVEAARSDALLLMGEVGTVERCSRRLLDESCADLDPLGIRLHSSKLAEVLYLTGRSEDAWRVLSASLHLGPPSPFGTAYYERTLALGAVIRADAGDLETARVLEREMDACPLTYRPVLGSMRTWAKAAILYASDEPAAAEALLLDAARADSAGGALASALLCWTARRSPYTPDQALEVQATYDRAPLPVFETLVRTHLAVTREDEAEMLASLEVLDVDPGRNLAWMVLDQVDSLRLSAGVKPLSEQAIRAFGSSAQPRPRGKKTQSSLSVLSDREYEVALLARSGMSNREIADRLVLSVRTVENHLYRLLRKAGLRRRDDLLGLWPEEA